MRLTITRKIVLGLGVISFISIAAMLIVYAGLNTVAQAVQKLAREEAPFNAAAYEMEVNVNGIGFAVLKYLATRNPQYSAMVAKDHIDFENHHAAYTRLIKSSKEKELGERIGALYTEFKTLGDGLMQDRDRQEDLFTKVSTNIEAIDQVLDGQLESAIARGAASQAVRFDKAITVANMEADIAETGFWVANYQRIPAAESKTLIFEKLEEVREGLARFLRLELKAEERGLALVVEGLLQQTAEMINEVVVLEDVIIDRRQRFIDLRLAIDQLLDHDIQPLALFALDVPRREAEQAAERAKQTLLYGIPGFLLSAGLVVVLFVRSITRPLRRLQSGTDAVSQGNLAYRIPAVGNDEFGEVAHRFNQMIEQWESTTVSKTLLLESETKLQQSVSDLRHEIAERERAEEQRSVLEAELRRSETMSAMGALTAGVAHEVRNPLFGISSTLDAMEERFGGRVELQRFIDVLRREANRMTKVMSDLLEYGKPTAPELSPGSIGDLIAKAMAACSPVAKGSGVVIAHEVGADIPSILCDHRRVVQVFQNLLENAIHFSPRGGLVTIAAETISSGGKTWVECVIRDCGPGFKPDDLPHLFEPFFTRRRGGTGLGLPIVLRIVEAHGGSIVVSNRVEGGAMVVVRLPVVPAEAHEPRSGEADGAQ